MCSVLRFLLPCALALAAPAAAAQSLINFVGATSHSKGDEAITTFDLAVPSGAAEGDLLVMSMYHGGDPNPAVFAPFAWTHLYEERTEAGKHSVYYRFAEADEPEFYTWSLDRGKHVAAGMAAYRNVHPGAPIASYTANRAAGVGEGSVGPIAVDDGMHLLLFSAVTADTAGVTPGATLTERYEPYAFFRTASLSDEAVQDSGLITRSAAVDAAPGDIFLLAVALRADDAENAPPALDPPADCESIERDVVSRLVRAEDADGDSLVYAARNLPPGLTIDPASGVIFGTIDPDAVDGSPYEVTVSATDLRHPPVEESFTWSVREASGSIAFVGLTNYTHGNQIRTTFSLDVPPGVRHGDLLVATMFHGYNNEPVLTPPDGWQLLHQERTEAGMHSVFYRSAGLAEPASYTWRLSIGKNVAGAMAAYRGVDPGTPIDTWVQVHAGGKPSTSVTVIPQTINDRLLLISAVKAPSATLTFDADLLERVDISAGTRGVQLAEESINGNDLVTRGVTADGDAEEIFLLAAALRPAVPYVSREAETVPDGFALGRNYPNPFTARTQIDFTLPAPERVRLSVFDALGRRVAVLVDERLGPGTHHVSFEPPALPAGTYWYRLDGERSRATRTMVLVR